VKTCRRHGGVAGFRAGEVDPRLGVKIAIDDLTATHTTTQAQGFHFSKAVAADLAGDLPRQGRIMRVDEASEEQGGADSPPNVGSVRHVTINGG
jgi:hypothetical protein